MRGNILKISQFLEKFYKMYFNIVKLILVLHKIRYMSATDSVNLFRKFVAPSQGTAS